MNASGQGGQVCDVSKDDENVISSTSKEDKATESEASKVASIVTNASPIATETYKSVEHNTESNNPGEDKFKPEKIPKDEVDKGLECEASLNHEHTDHIHEEIEKDNLTPQDRECSNVDHIPKASSNSSLNDSLGDDFELKWDDDESVPKTDDVLKLLDWELGITDDVSKPGKDDQIKSTNNIENVSNDVEISGNDSIENMKLIDQIDDLIGDDNNDNSKLEQPEKTEKKEKDNDAAILENIYVTLNAAVDKEMSGDVENGKRQKSTEENSNNAIEKKADSTFEQNMDNTTPIDNFVKAKVGMKEVSNDMTEFKIVDDHTTSESHVNPAGIAGLNAKLEKSDTSSHAVGIETSDNYVEKLGQESSTIEENIEMTLESSAKPTIEEMDVDIVEDHTIRDSPSVTVCEKSEILDTKQDETENTTETVTIQRKELFSPNMFAEDLDNESPTKIDIPAAVESTSGDSIKVAENVLEKTLNQVDDSMTSTIIRNTLEEKAKQGIDSGVKTDYQCNTSKFSTEDSKMDISNIENTKVPLDDNLKLLEAEKADSMDVELNEGSKDTSQKDDNQLKVSTETENDVIMIEIDEVLGASSENIAKYSKVQQKESDVDVTESIPTYDNMSEVQKGVTVESNDDTAVNDDEFLDTTINPNIHHRITKPNVMLDIPTQELSDIEAELDDDSYSELIHDTTNTESEKKDGNVDDGKKNNDSNLESTTNKEQDGKLDNNDVKIDKMDETEVEKSEIDTEKTYNSYKTKGTSPDKIDVPGWGLRMVPISQLMKPFQSEVKIDLTLSKSKDIPKEEKETSSVQIDQPKLVNVNTASKPEDPTTADKNDETISSESDEANTPIVDLNKSTSKVDVKNDARPSRLETKEQSEAGPITTKTNERNEAGTSISKVNEQSEAAFVKEDDAQPSTSKLTDDAQPSTSKLTDDAQPSTSKLTDDAQPTTSKLTDDAQPSTSKLTDDAQPSTSKLTDAQPFTSELTDDAVASTSKDILLEKLTPDTADEIQEVTDSLGLLAETSRVVDDDEDADDEEPEDPEADDNDDDDFDPYDDSNSQMAIDQDDSTTPPPEMHHADKPALELKPGDSDEGTLDIGDDIECVENELPEIDLPGDDTLEMQSVDGKATKDEPEIIDADEHKDGQTDKSCPPEKIIDILEKVLGHQSTDAQVKKSKTSGLTAVKVMTYVDVGGSSSDDDVFEVKKSDVTSVNIPKGVEVMSTSTSGLHSTSEIVSKEGEVIISGVPKPPPQKVSKLNTSEVSISVKSTPAQIDIQESNEEKSEIFNLDSDEEDSGKVLSMDEAKERAAEELPASDRKCINPQCTGNTSVYHRADRATAGFYSLSRRRAVVCEQCSRRVSERTQALLTGIKDLRPLMELDMACPSQQLVEISDSESDDDGSDDEDMIGAKGAEFLEEHLADVINETWIKYKMESRLKETESYLMDELDKMEAGAKEIDSLLNECQKKTDYLRTNFYKDFEPRRRHLGPIVIYDTPLSSYSHTEKDVEVATESRYPKRRSAGTTPDPPAKRPAIPLGYIPLEPDTMETKDFPVSEQSKADDDKDISVVKLSAESAPADLPPCGEISRPPLKTGMVVYAMRNAFGTWLKGRVLEVQAKTAGIPYTHCRIKFDHKVKNPCKVLAARCLAYTEPSAVRMTIGTRIIALFKDPQNTARRDSFYSGVVAEIPNPVNSYRYLVFFDDGYAQYVSHHDTRVVCESSSLVWEEVHPFIRDFICNYLLSYPERPMVRLHAGEELKTEWNGKWWASKVLQVDASIALIYFEEDKRTEWIYRGSTRLAPLFLELQAAEKAGGRQRSRLPRSKAQMRSNMPCVEYTRSDEQTAAKAAEAQVQVQHQEELRRQKAVAKKSTKHPPAQGTPLDGVISRVVYYTPKNAVKPYKMSPHICTIKCKRTDVLSLKDLRTYNPLAKPLLSGWERQTVRFKGQREVMYRAPCGRRLRNMEELHKYLRILNSDLSVDLFDFTPGTHCLAEFVLNTCIVGKKDLSHGKENVPVPCVNYFDDSLPEFCSYNTERTPTAGVPLNLDPEFLCGCDCTDDCVDKTKCACWKLTLEGARTIGLDSPNVGYEYRRLPEPLPSGIYECNSRCKCKNTCLNRVAQHPLNMKLQVFKTSNRGWGIRALNDVPKGSFVCVYAGNLLTDATANLDGLNEGDEYLAELDYIEVVEGMKEGYEEDIPDADKKLDKKTLSGKSDSDESESTSESEEEIEPNEKDADFQPGYIPHPDMVFKKSLRKREKAKKKEQEKEREEAKKRDDCITISDDEEVREPSRFTAQAGMADKAFSSKHRSVRSLYGKDEACYIMDAKVQGNIGRYLNHSCHPNVFVQNVFVDTHDPRFPWVAFFALSNVRAGTELTWNYNYDVGSVPGKVLYCYCGAPNCRGRLL